VAIVTPHQPAAGYIAPQISSSENNSLLGTGSIVASIMAASELKSGHQYQITFGIDTIDQVANNDHGLLYTTNQVTIFDLNEDSALVYSESPDHFLGTNLVHSDTLDYWSINEVSGFESDVFDGVQIVINQDGAIASYDNLNSGWRIGGGGTVMHVNPSIKESSYLPWDYDIVFTGEDSAFVGMQTNKAGVRDENGDVISRNSLLTKQAFDFYVVNTTFQDSAGNFELMDMIVYDINGNDIFDKYIDKIIVGPQTGSRWRATLMVIDFNNGNDATYPKENDIYSITFQRPFFVTDTYTVFRFSYRFSK